MCNTLIFKDKLNSIQPYGNRLTKIYEDLRRLTKVVEIVFPKGRTGFFYDYLHLSTTIWKQAYEDLRRFTKVYEDLRRFTKVVEMVFPIGLAGFFYDYLHLSTTIWKLAYEDLRRFTKAWEGPERFIHMVLHMVSTTVYNHTK